MLLEVSKNAAVTHLFRSIFKKTLILQRHNCVQRVRYCAVLENRRFEKANKNLQSITISDNVLKYFYSSQKSGESVKVLDKLTFETVCAETLDSLSEYFEELVEAIPSLKNADVMYSDGVLTVNLGKNHGTYVINRQTPNFQIWLSSPSSGPKRYDYVDGTWIYKHDKTTLHSLLDKEIKEIANAPVNFVEKCVHSKPEI